ncbi:MAG: hypothetical protein IKB36_00965 [Clostridia bacterium]|nr:hypothetical protein [Clostridia bacterium]
MMRTVYIIVKFLTLPGAILHAFFEHMSCRWTKVIVDDARVVQANEMLSHVDHELIKRKSASFDVCFIPFFFNLALGFLLLMNGATTVYYFGKYNDGLAWICLYLGISLCTNLFPQIEDVMMLKENFFANNDKKISKILVAPFYAIFFVGAKIESLGITLLTSIIFSFAVPTILGLFIPTLYNLMK